MRKSGSRVSRWIPK